MPIFKIEVFKSLNGERWGNVYHVQAADLATADGSAGDIVGTEQSFHLSEVLFESVRTSDVVPNTDQFITSPLNANGSRSSSTNDLMPLWDTLRVDLGVGAGRPGRKYYRGVLSEGDTFDDDQKIETALATSVASSIGTLISTLNGAGTPLVQPDGDVISSAAVFPRVQMRQLHRRRRRAS